MQMQARAPGLAQKAGRQATAPGAQAAQQTAPAVQRASPPEPARTAVRLEVAIRYGVAAQRQAGRRAAGAARVDAMAAVERDAAQPVAPGRGRPAGPAVPVAAPAPLPWLPHRRARQPDAQLHAGFFRRYSEHSRYPRLSLARWLPVGNPKTAVSARNRASDRPDQRPAFPASQPPSAAAVPGRHLRTRRKGSRHPEYSRSRPAGSRLP